MEKLTKEKAKEILLKFAEDNKWKSDEFGFLSGVISTYFAEENTIQPLKVEFLEDIEGYKLIEKYIDGRSNIIHIMIPLVNINLKEPTQNNYAGSDGLVKSCAKYVVHAETEKELFAWLDTIIEANEYVYTYLHMFKKLISGSYEVQLCGIVKSELEYNEK